MKTILFGYDGSEQAKSAMADFGPASLPTPVRAIVITVADVWMPSDPGAQISKLAHETFAEAKKLSSEGARRLKGLFPDWEISPETIADSPGWGIIKKAESLKADLIAIGAHSQPAIFDRYFFGSIASEILAEARCSVRVCRPRELKNPHLRILLPVDGSADSALALREASSRNWPRGTEFKILTVLDPRICDAGDTQNNFGAELRDKGHRVETIFFDGNPKAEIIKLADAWRADCIFLGARGLHHGTGRNLGSVASAIARRADCSVEICRPKPAQHPA